jgi:hypothetical protein
LWLWVLLEVHGSASGSARILGEHASRNDLRGVTAWIGSNAVSIFALRLDVVHWNLIFGKLFRDVL